MGYHFFLVPGRAVPPKISPSWLLLLSFFRQHAASIYGFVRFVSCVKKNLKYNISLTEAQIFMKFETYVYKIVVDHQPNFHKDPCKDARARGVNARTHVKKNLYVRSLDYILCAPPPVRKCVSVGWVTLWCVPLPVCPFNWYHCGSVPPLCVSFHWKTIFVWSLHAAYSALLHFF